MRRATSTEVRASEGPSTGSPHPAPAWQPSLGIVLSYATVAALWIVFSDRMVGAVASDPQTITQLQTLKGWAFVALSAMALFFLIKKTIGSIHDAAAEGAATDELLRGIVDNSPLGIAVVDEDGTYVRVNRAFADLLAYPEEQLTGMNFRDVTVAEDEEPSAQIYVKLREGAERQVTLEKRYVRSDGTMVWAHLTAARLGRDAPGYALAIVADISARRERVRLLQQAHEALTVSDRQRKRLLEALLNAEESERQRIAADIHDDSLQVLTSAVMYLDLVAKPEITDEQRAKLVWTIRDQLAAAMRRLRKLVFDLRPALLDEEGLAPALERFLSEAGSDRQGFTYAVTDDSEAAVPAEVATVAYRIAREAIANSLKHSRAAHLAVALSTQGDTLTITVSDNGSGFDTEHRPDDGQEHLGLRMMQERAGLIGGTVSITSSPSEGTRVVAELPLTQGPPNAQLRLDDFSGRRAE